MGTIVAVAFADIFMATVETELLNKSAIKPICWKIYMDDIFSLCVTESPGGTVLYGLYRYVRLQMVWLFSRFGLK